MKTDIIRVYHGSNMQVKEPSLSYGRSDADFGNGFYISTKYEMAEKWACRKNNPIITEYTLDLRNLSIYEFKQDVEWLDFVIDNRRMDIPSFDIKKYDLLIGPTADDKLFATIEQYESGFISEETAIEVLNCMKIGTQICIRTNEGLKNLHFEQSIHLSSERTREVQEQNRRERKTANELTSEIIRNSMRRKNKRI